MKYKKMGSVYKASETKLSLKPNLRHTTCICDFALGFNGLNIRGFS